MDAIGLNCATGPKEMNDAVRYLALNSTKQVSVLPNAGLPENVGGHPVYKLTSQELADYHKHFVEDYGVRIVGGCCGTTPEHLQAVVDAVSGIEPTKREVKRVAAASSALYQRPSRSRTQAADRRRINEHDHACRSFPQAGAGQEI